MLCMVRAPPACWARVTSGAPSSAGPVAVDCLCSVLEEICRVFAPLSPSNSHAKAALTALRWSCVATAHSTEPSYTLLRCQATYLAAMAASPKKRVWQTGGHVLCRLWRAEPQLVVASLRCLLSGEPYPSALCLMAELVQHLAQSGRGLEPSLQVGVARAKVGRALSSPCRWVWLFCNWPLSPPGGRAQLLCEGRAGQPCEACQCSPGTCTRAATLTSDLRDVCPLSLSLSLVTGMLLSCFQVDKQEPVLIPAPPAYPQVPPQESG